MLKAGFVGLSAAIGLSELCGVYGETCLNCAQDVQSPSTDGHLDSMLQKIFRGRTTEIDDLNGCVTASGSRHQIATPVNACIADLIRFRESLPNR